MPFHNPASPMKLLCKLQARILTYAAKQHLIIWVSAAAGDFSFIKGFPNLKALLGQEGLNGHQRGTDKPTNSGGLQNIHH